MIRGKRQAYSSGVVQIYRAENAAAPGNKPIQRLVPLCRLHYRERTIGAVRHYAALQSNTMLTALLRCPLMRNVTTLDIAVLPSGEQYHIRQIQNIEGSAPPVMDLSLERVPTHVQLTQPDPRRTAERD